MARTLNKYLTRVHKWAGLVLALFILSWFGSGFFMTLFPIDQVRGRHLVETPVWSLTDAELTPIEIAMTGYEGQLTGAQLISVVGRPAYLLIGDQGPQLLDARTGAAWAALGEADIRTVAQDIYKGEGEILSLLKLSKKPKDYSGALPVWQVRFDDREETRLYLDPNTAELKATRTRLWRAFDIAWKFHILDVTGEDNFNAWWLRVASGSALIFALSGVGLLWFRTLGRPRRRKRQTT